MDVGVIGVGSMGINHVRVYSEIANLIGISDVDEATGKRVAGRFHTRYYKDYRRLLRYVDAVSLATPTELHLPIGKEIIEAGVHLLIEKPLSMDVESARELVALAEKNGVVLATGHIERHNPVITYVKGLIDSGHLGTITSISTKRVSSLPDRIRDVGVVLDLGIHDIDIQRYLAQSEPLSVYALGGRMKREKFEDHANILIEFENGVKGVLEINWLTPMKVRKLYLTGTEKFVECDYIDQHVQISSSSYSELDESNLFKVPLELDHRHVHLSKQEPLKRELQDLLDAIEEKRPPLVTGQDGVEAIRIAEGAIVSFKTGQKVDLTDFKIE